MARAAYALLADTLRSSLDEMITEVMHRVATLLPARPNRSRAALSSGEAVPDRKELADAVAREVTAALSTKFRDVNELVRRATEDVGRDR